MIHTYTSHTYKYHHIHTYTCIYILANSLYMQVYDIHAYTCIYLHIHAYVYPVRVASIWHTCIYLCIHTYTCIYLLSTYFLVTVRIRQKYVNILHIRAYTYINIRTRKKRVLKKNVCILYVFVCIADVYDQYMRCILYVYQYMHVYARIDPTNNFPCKKYVQIRVYVHIHTKYIQYTHNINHHIHTKYISRYMIVYVCIWMYM